MRGVAFRDSVAPEASQNATVPLAACPTTTGGDGTIPRFGKSAVAGTLLANLWDRPLHAPPGRAAGRLPNITQNPEELDA